jgi:uncharacterized membrane protein YqgA involved in biofilm formation
MIGVLVNTILVVVGSVIGMVFRKGMPVNITKTVMIGLGLFTSIFGIKMGLEMRHPLIVVLSIVLGGLLGEFARIEEHVEGIGTRLKHLVQTRDDASFTRGYVFASLLFCVGPMTVLGSLQAGLQNQPELLLVKSLMDGVSAIVLSATLGIGVAFSALTVLVFQGSLVLLAGQLHFLTEPVYFDNLTGVGGILIFGIGIKLLNLAEIKVGNFLPALLLVVIFSYIATLI